MVLLTSILGLTSGFVGCRGRAHDDLYRAKMAQQIRVLEDQLYEADYQNRVLHDELNRARGQAAPCETVVSPPSGAGSAATAPSGNVKRSGPDYNVLGDGPKDSGKPDLPMPPPVESENANESGKASGAGEDEPQQPLVDPPPTEGGAPGTSLGMPGDLPAPVPDPDTDAGDSEVMSGELLPPKSADPADDQIIPGEALPPGEEQKTPPDKIQIPPGTKTLLFAPEPIEGDQLSAEPDFEIPVPDHLELNDGLSGVHRSEGGDENDGLYLVVTIADASGKRLNLEDYDVDADLSIVVLDPEDKSEDPRVGRWDFTADEVRELIQRKPVDGFHIPLRWQDRIPAGKDVIVHVRLAAAEEEMRCQGRVRLEESVAASHWLPRG